MRTRTFLASTVATFIAVSTVATALAATIPVIRSCARLSGKDKAQCQWENHKAYEEAASLLQTLEQTIQSSSSSAPTIVLPSCSRLSGKDRALCQWNNAKKMQPLKRNPHIMESASASSAVAPNDTGGSVFVKTCGRAAGKERARCVLQLRKDARAKLSSSTSSAK